LCVFTHLTGRTLHATLRQSIDWCIALAGRKLAFAGIGADTVSVLELALRHCVSTRNRRQFWIGLADLGSGPPNSRAENVELINSVVANAIDSTGIDRAASIL
jgi:hypothetical protein